MNSTGQNKEPEKRTQLEIEQEEENRKIRRLQLMMNMVMSVLAQDQDLTLEQASEMIANAKAAALAMFPDKELAYNLIYRPRFQRLLNERFRLQYRRGPLIENCVFPFAVRCDLSSSPLTRVLSPEAIGEQSRNSQAIGWVRSATELPVS